jgi:hypothetical protein
VRKVLDSENWDRHEVHVADVVGAYIHSYESLLVISCTQRICMRSLVTPRHSKNSLLAAYFLSVNKRVAPVLDCDVLDCNSRLDRPRTQENTTHPNSIPYMHPLHAQVVVLSKKNEK